MTKVWETNGILRPINKELSSESLYFPADLQPYPSFELRIVAINSPYQLDAAVAGIYLSSCIVNE